MHTERHARAHDVEPRSVARWIDDAFCLLVVVLFVGCAVAVGSGAYQIRPVLSGSMRPDLPVGGVVVTQRVPVSSLRVGDVIVFHEPDTADALVVHRIVSLTPDESGPVVQTKGDANGGVDPWTIRLRGDDAYRAVLSVPWLGYVAVWAHNPAGGRVLVSAGIGLIALATVGSLLYWRRSSRHVGLDRPRVQGALRTSGAGIGS